MRCVMPNSGFHLRSIFVPKHGVAAYEFAWTTMVLALPLSFIRRSSRSSSECLLLIRKTARASAWRLWQRLLNGWAAALGSNHSPALEALSGSNYSQFRLWRGPRIFV